MWRIPRRLIALPCLSLVVATACGSLGPIAPVPLAATSRQEAIQSALRIDRNSGAIITRVEAKLVRYDAFEHAALPGVNGSVIAADARVWVIVHEGLGLSSGFGSPFASHACLVTLTVLKDGVPDRAAVFGCASESAWPAWFDTLIDLAGSDTSPTVALPLHRPQ